MEWKKIFIIFIFFLFANLASAGTIRGKVSAEKLKTQSDILIYIERVEAKEFPPPNKSPLYIPHVLPVVLGTKVGFKNSDTILQNVFGVGDDEFDLGTWKGDEIRYFTFNKLGEVAILCNLHPSMEAYIVVL